MRHTTLHICPETRALSKADKQVTLEQRVGQMVKVLPILVETFQVNRG